AFADGRHAQALALLEDVRDRAHRFGGSHAQRDLLTLTLIEAALRAGRTTVARHYLAERLVQRPASGLGARLMQRCA
ncbi:MAG: tetratricopeptide repeat protein, partial [Deltaproteobacteria bacterium]|nr:tetratricopeptide repeat protein [Kofleriaceae bacterium]